MNWQLCTNQEHGSCLLNIIIKLAHKQYYVKNMCQLCHQYQLTTLTNLTEQH